MTNINEILVLDLNKKNQQAITIICIYVNANSYVRDCFQLFISTFFHNAQIWLEHPILWCLPFLFMPEMHEEIYSLELMLKKTSNMIQVSLKICFALLWRVLAEMPCSLCKAERRGGFL